jgi:hypothetical protein
MTGADDSDNKGIFHGQHTFEQLPSSFASGPGPDRSTILVRLVLQCCPSPPTPMIDTGRNGNAAPVPTFAAGPNGSMVPMPPFNAVPNG